MRFSLVSDVRSDVVIPRSVRSTRAVETKGAEGFNFMDHRQARDNHFQPYPSKESVIARCEHRGHLLKKFRDLQFPDMVWAGKRIWRERLGNVEMTTFQEAMISRGLPEALEKEDAMPPCASIPIGYAAVLNGECLEMISDLNKEIVHNDLLVNRLTFALLLNANRFL